jgi:carbonic anhydrase
MRPTPRPRSWVVLCVALSLPAALIAGVRSEGSQITSPARVRNAAAATAEPEAHSSTKWGYTGAYGPAHWGSLDPTYRVCSAGQRQSPINLVRPARGTLPRLRFSYRNSSFAVDNDGHSLGAEAGSGNIVTVSGVAYQLSQFHFHAPSEHRVGGHSFALELHLVNKSSSGRLLVVAVLIRPGRANRAFDRLIAALPASPGQRRRLTGLNALSLLPEKGQGARYIYSGSLTTPPCTEGVSWNVFATPVELSPAQIRRFTAIYDHNNRPLQPSNGRPVRLGRGSG